MVEDKDLGEMLDRFRKHIPPNAIALRSASAQIISGWINSGRPYPHDLVYGLVNIESSIEDSIEENLRDAQNLQNDTEDAYMFHISRFMELLDDLRKSL